MNGSMPDPREDEDPNCPRCGSAMERVTCWQCGGEAGFHDCGEDTCMCLDKEELTKACEECGGDGGFMVCWARCEDPDKNRDKASRSPPDPT